MDNQVVAKALTHTAFSSKAIMRAVGAICGETRFTPRAEVSRRTLYDADKVWRVRFVGMFEGHPACLHIENMRLETDEEKIREAFRAQGSFNIRPPHTYAHAGFDAITGYAWSIEEDASTYKKLYEPDADPCHTVREFAEMYKRLAVAVRYPFWTPDKPGQDAPRYAWNQMKRWQALSHEKYPGWTTTVESEGRKDGAGHHAPLIEDLLGAAYARLKVWQPLRFQHAHLSGDDIRVSPEGHHVVFANHYWSWRPPGYDVAFAVWHQWMHLPMERRNAAGVRQITENWLCMVNHVLKGLASQRDVWVMLLNRLYGALLLDLPARRAIETPEMVDALKNALFAESRRLLTKNRL